MSEHLEDISSLEFSEANPLAEIVTVEEVIKHPNADLLDVVSPDGSNINFAVVKKGQFKPGDKAIWIDSVNDPKVPVSNSNFAHMQKLAKSDGYARVKTVRLRGIVSRGILIPMPPEWSDKTNKEITEILEIKKCLSNFGPAGGSYSSGLATKGPTVLLGTAKYDIESVNKNWRSIPNGIKVYITEKIHGTNASYGWLPYEGERKFWVRSRTLFKKEPQEEGSGGLWWDAAIKFSLKEKLQPYPGYVIYGEIYGKVQDLKYGIPNDIGFAAFDCWDSNNQRYLTWLELTDFCNKVNIPLVPVIQTTFWNTESGIPAEIAELAEGKTMLNGENIREGIVIRADLSPFGIEQSSRFISLEQRYIYKLVGNAYLTR